jgi:antirestriction protein ArdC
MQNSDVTFKIGGDRAFYSPALDTIQMPPDVAFDRREYWATTIVHEINHSIGHPTPMNRDLTPKFGSDAYACEEARVEMAAVFVCNTLNLPIDFENSARYVGNWLRKLREDKRELLHAAADAQKIADYVLGVRPRNILRKLAS